MRVWRVCHIGLDGESRSRVCEGLNAKLNKSRNAKRLPESLKLTIGRSMPAQLSRRPSMPMRNKLLSRVVRSYSKISSHTTIRSASWLVAIIACASSCFAQQPEQASAPESQQTAASASMLTVPAWTKIQMTLLRPITTQSAKSGDTVYLQTTFPVMVGNKMLIPAGTFVQGILASFKRHKDTVDLQLQSASLIFSNGYNVSLPGPDAIPGQDADIRTKDGHPKAAAGAYAAATGGGAAIGGIANGVSGAITGAAIGGPVGFIVAVILVNHGRSMEIEAGSPVDIALVNPLLLDERQIAEATHKASPLLAVNKPKASTSPALLPRSTGICYAPGTPGTPDTVIPGPPGQAATVIPGTPGTPGTPYPCPQ